MARFEGKAPNGKGPINEAAVDAEGNVAVRALTETDMAHAVDEGVAFTLHSTYSLTGGEEAISLNNNGRDIHVERIVVSTAATGIVLVKRMTSGAPAGTVITAKNLKLGQAVAADITAFGNASVTGTVVGDIIDSHDIGTADPYTFEMDGLIIPLDETIFVEFTTGAPAVVHVCIWFHFED